MRKVSVICMALAGLLSVGALAASVTASWQNATLNEDGSSIPATGPGSIDTTRVEYGTCNGTAFGVKAGEFLVPSVTLSQVVDSLSPGVWCFRAYHKNTYGQESAPSLVKQVTIPAPKPRPPQNFSVG